MNGDHRRGNVHQFRAARSRSPENVVVPGVPPDSQREKSVAHPSRIYKIVDIVPRPLESGAKRMTPHGLGPAVMRNIERLIPIEIPPAANHHEFFKSFANSP